MARPKKAVLSSEEEDSSEGSNSPARSPRKKIHKRAEKQKKEVKKSPPRKKVHAPSTEEVVGEKDTSEDEEGNPLAEEYDDDNLLSIQVPPRPAPCMEPDGSGQRLIITDIIVENFKSYYGVRRIGPFHTNFTSIIGPNGSGKSNVIDALLFVFGYKASKIRSKKLAVLIHSSAGKDNITSCTVKINFQMVVEDKPEGANRKGPNEPEESNAPVKYKVVPNSHFSVSRTAHKSNQSEYRLNGQKMTIKEIAKKLRSVGIDLVHNRFLILQGEVEQISMMKPKAANPNEEGMLEYLEDIIGSSRFKEPITRLTDKLTKLQEEKTHQTSKVNTAVKEKEAMDGPVQEMIRFLEVENDISTLKAKITLRKKYRACDEMAALEPDKESLQGKVTEMEEQLATVLAELKEKKKEINTVMKGMDEKSETINRLEGELQQCHMQAKSHDNKMRLHAENMKRLAKEIEKDKEALEKEKKAPVEAEAKMQQLKDSIEELVEAKNTAQEQYDLNFPKYTKKSEADQLKKKKLEEEYDSVAQRLAEAEGKHSLAEGQLRNLMEEYEKKKANVEQLEKALAKNREEIAAKKEQLKVTKERKEEVDKEHRGVRQDLERWRERSEQITKEVEGLRVLADLSAEAVNNQKASTMTEALEAERHAGRIPKFYGRLGDLGTIDGKYDTAISTTCAALDNYVVEDVATANACVEVLRKGNLGMGTFLMLDKQSHFSSRIEKCPQRTPPGVHRLFDLVKCDPQFKTAFYYGIRDALIVDNLDQATEYAKKFPGFKYITLRGETLEPSGSMVGGGRPVEGRIGKRRAPGVAEDPKKIEEISQAYRRLEEYDEEKSRLAAERKKGEMRVMQLAAAQQEVKQRIDALGREISTLTDLVETQEAQLVKLNEALEKSKLDEKQVERQKREIEQLAEERDAAKTEADSYKTRIKAIEDAINLIFNKTVKVHKDALRTAEKDLEKTEKDISKQHAIISASEHKIRQAQSRLEEREKEADGKRNKNSEFTDMKSSYKDRLADLTKQLEQAQTEKKELEGRLVEMRDSNRHLDEKEVDSQKELKALTNSLNDVKGQLKILKRAVADYDKELNCYKLHNITELMVDIPESSTSLEGNKRGLIVDGSDSEEEEGEEKKKKKKKVDKKKNDNGEEEEEEGGDEEGMEVNEGEGEGGEDVQMDQDENDALAEGAATPRERKNETELIREGKMPQWTREQIKKLDMDSVKMMLDDREKEREQRKKTLQPHILEDYKGKLAKMRKETEVLREITKKYTDHRDKLEEFKKERLAEFMAGFECISYALREMYQMITLGGDASLELKDLIDPFAEGVQFMVRPPKKSWKQIENLSGGEKTLSSLALVFALHHYRPTPLYVMDEIDAALDFRNVSIIGHYIKDRTKNAQFIIISLRNNMFELADRLIGIYKVHDCTRNVVVDPKGVLNATKENREGLNKLRRFMQSSSTQKLLQKRVEGRSTANLSQVQEEEEDESMRSVNAK